jgi:hypothetical protein
MSTEEQVAARFGQLASERGAGATSHHAAAPAQTTAPHSPFRRLARPRRAGLAGAWWIAGILAVVGALGAPPAADAAEVTGTASVSGTVTKAEGGGGVESMEVCVAKVNYEGAVESGNCVHTDSQGKYTDPNLPEGEYKVEFTGFVCEGETECVHKYVTQSYNEKRAFEEGTRFELKAGQARGGINASMRNGGTISGTVKGEGKPVENMPVCSLQEVPTTKFELLCVFTDAAGGYKISGLAPGSAFIVFTGEVCGATEEECTPVYNTEYYKAVPSLKEAQPISVFEDMTTSGIDATFGNGLGLPPPVNFVLPKLTGVGAVGGTLHCSEGSWLNSPTRLEYGWRVNGVPAPGNATANFPVTSAEQGKAVSCLVTASNAAGSTVAQSGAVVIPNMTTTTTSTAPVTPPSTTGHTAKSAPESVIALAARLAPVLGSDAVVTVRCQDSSGCEGHFKLLARVRHGKHGHARNVVIGTTSFVMLERGEETLEVHLTAEGQSLLNRAGAGGLRVTLTGNGIQTRTLILKRVRHGHGHAGALRASWLRSPPAGWSRSAAIAATATGGP